MIIINGRGIITAFNPAAQDFFGFSNEDRQRTYSARELYESEAEAEAVARLLQQENPSRFGKVIDGYRAQLIEQSGQVRPMLITATALSDETHSEQSIICHFRDITETEALEQRVRELSQTDFLTGMYKYRSIFEVLDKEISRSTRYMHPFALVCFSLGGLVITKEQLGALACDEILKLLASITHGALRGNDSSYRQSTTEFLALCPETDVRGALRVAERLRDTFIASLPQVLEIPADTLREPITLNLGVTVFYGGNSVDSNELIEQAVQAMVLAKRESSGNAIVLHKALREPERKS